MRWAAIWNYFLVNMGIVLCGISYTLPSAIFPNQALSRGISVSMSGLILGSSYIVTFLLTPICGKLIYKFGTKKIFVIGILIIGLANIAFGFLDYIEDGTIYFWVSLSLRIISAMGEAVGIPSSYPLGASQFTKENKGKAMSIIECCWGTGAAIGPAFGGFLNMHGGFTMPFWIVGALFILNFLLVVCCFKDTHTDKEPDTGSTSWKDMFLCPGMIAYGLACAFAGVSTTWFMGTMEPHLFTQFGSSSGEIGLVLTLYSLAYTLFTPVMGALMDRGLKPLTSVIIGHVIIAATYLTLGPLPGLEDNVWFQNIPMKGASMFVQGFGAAFTFIGTLLGMNECTKDGNLPQNDQTTAMVSGVWLLATCLGCSIGAYGGGVTYDFMGFAWSSFWAALVMAVSVPASLLMFKKSPTKKKEYPISTKP